MNKYGKYSFMIDLDEVCFFNVNTDEIKFIFKSGKETTVTFSDIDTEKIGQEMFSQIKDTKR